ncbi:hemolysin family protein [Alteraurantiacibacter aquimixticola]|uniref:HlyC/CorC family transporter n=1 Tax=Alteraurantiacibacter aquimixticola TaxID=2489173 RepID=A0A4T3F3I8_9SPHN|nr:hemolysin family protein [Alteraurantiacibacter aquimixticola]TIX49210.1 HlyC/CorC family transporter [Alteraurantiacibacter aquimixticola]
MSPFPWSDLAVLAGLILLNGVFAMSELAIVSARTSQLRVAAENGSKSAKVALELAAQPGKFLSTVQIGITLIGIVNGAVSGSALGGPVGERIALLGVEPELAGDIGFVLVIVLTTYFSLVVGELVPKQLALRAANPVALIMARPMALLAQVAAPFVWLLDSSSSMILRLTGVSHAGEHGLTAQELQMIFADATHSGVIEEQERAILSGIMKLAEKPVRELMTPRTELDWIDADAGEAAMLEIVAETPHSTLPVAEGSPDKVLGVVKVREILALRVAGEPIVLAELIRKAEVLPDQLDAMDALRVLQQSGTGMAMVHDEYGHLDGIVTTADLLTAIAGSFASHQDEGDEPMVVERADGSLLVSGAMPADALAERLEIGLPDQREFATAAGYVLFMLKRLPVEGEYFEEQGWRIEVIDMDGRRVDKLLVARRPDAS